ncbi:hypothetical protein FGG44_gp61 [Mycobacterium phage MacnCheese]|uniref:Uncharacterized protein n=1 Tax=Mycobacterium phage MacnCheese TaxID=2927982 RepID=I6X3D1_9CAUD|nr:hypothetical protein FGG44_gp61 [Mycobacterium phage MacnCheese]AFN37752.1 hypothetical protein MACNCHEESE_61 [Mycobacterium phage MacnCheese]
MSNYAHVGKVEFSIADGTVGGRPQFRAVEISVGVRADTGEVLTSVDGKNGGPWPRLAPAKASELAVLLARAAEQADALATAYQAYQAALQAAEDKFAEALKGETK